MTLLSQAAPGVQMLSLPTTSAVAPNLATWTWIREGNALRESGGISVHGPSSPLEVSVAAGEGNGIADGAGPTLAAALGSAVGDGAGAKLAAALGSAVGDGVSEGGLDVAAGAAQPTMDSIAHAVMIPRLMIPPRGK